MLTEIDWLIFPNDCEVLATPHSVSPYLIEKNGSTALRWYAEQHAWPILRNEQISELDSVDVFVRRPRSRYLSGLYTWLQWIKRDHNIDLATAEWFATEYSFLNRHFLPQFHWLLNLARYVAPEQRIQFHRFEDFTEHFPHNHNPHGFKYDPDWGQQVIQRTNLDFWFYLDDILREYAGQSLTWREFLNDFKTKRTDTWETLTQTNRAINYVLSQT